MATYPVTRRTETLAEHRGQVAFPGGAMNTLDRTRSDTALREAGEEIGLRSDDVTVLGCLAPHSTFTGWHVTPVVATIPHPYPFRVNHYERITPTHTTEANARFSFSGRTTARSSGALTPA